MPESTTASAQAACSRLTILPPFYEAPPLDPAIDPPLPKLTPWRWWLALGALWALATATDRLWLALDQRLPAWDQADYLNSAVDHGRALGLLAGGGWHGWAALLDLSPKIPPLASLVNGSVMAVAGEAPDQASWALALWHGLLLVVVAAWGRQLHSPGFGLLTAALTALAPAIAAVRVDYTLDLPLAASTTLALWWLGRWQAPGPGGGRWSQALLAGLAVAAALLIKQSALLVLTAPGLWAGLQALGQPRRRPQVLAALALVLALPLPWLHHNWITSIGGTNRAVVESAAKEGDPAVLSLASLLWYPRLWPAQLGLLTTAIGLAGGLLGAWRSRSQPWRHWLRHPVRALPPGWAWLIGCALSGWLLTCLSPNKDARYITPVLPLLLLLLARGWWQLGLLLQRRWGARTSLALLTSGLLASSGASAVERAGAVQEQQRSPLPQLVARLRQAVGTAPTTVVVLPSAPDLNQHNLTSTGRLGGGQIEGRQIGKRPGEATLVADQARWLVLATGDQGSRHRTVRELSRALRRDPRYERLERWPWSKRRQVELWRRRPAAPVPSFVPRFIRLARGLEAGPTGLARLIEAIGPQHQLDAHFHYQREVEVWAQQRLVHNANDRDALWSQAVLGLVQNRPAAAIAGFGALEQADPANPWPHAYRAVVHLADWNPWQARAAVTSAPMTPAAAPVLEGLEAGSALLSGDLRVLPSLPKRLQGAIRAVAADLNQPAPPP